MGQIISEYHAEENEAVQRKIQKILDDMNTIRGNIKVNILSLYGRR